MTMPSFTKWAALTGCVIGFIATGVVGFWPNVLNVTRIPLYAAVVGAWYIFVTICYLVYKFVYAGLRRSKP